MKSPGPDIVVCQVQKRLRQMGDKAKKVRVTRADHMYDPVNKADWWMVRAEIDTPVNRLSRYYELFSDVEDVLEEKDRLNILIVPTVPEAQAAA